MSYAGFLAQNELFWSLLVGVALGGALADATRLPSRSRNPRRARERKWVRFWLWLAGTVAAAAAGMIVPEDPAIISVPSVYTAAAGLFLTAAALRFPRTGGFAVGLLLSLLAVAAAVLLQPWTPVREPRVLAEVVILTMEEDRMSVELTRGESLESPDAANGSGAAVVVPISNADLQAELDWIKPSPYLFLLGADLFVHLAEPGSTPRPSFPEFLSVWGLFEEDRATSRQVPVNLLQRYRIMAIPEPNQPVTVVRIR